MSTPRFLAAEAIVGVGLWLAIPCLVTLLFLAIAVAAGVVLFKWLAVAVVPLALYLAMRPRKCRQCRQCKQTVKTPFCAACGTQV